MAAVQETVERVRSVDVEQYKYGFVTEIESDKAPKGLSEDTVRFISVTNPYLYCSTSTLRTRSTVSCTAAIRHSTRGPATGSCRVCHRVFNCRSRLDRACVAVRA